MSADAATEKQFQALTEHIEVLVQQVNALQDPEARATAQELLQALMELHRTVLARITEVIAGSTEPGRELLLTLARDPLVSGLLVLYDLHPDDVETRIAHAVQKLRRSHAGLELVEIAGGVVRLKINSQSNGHGCQASGDTLKQAVEAAIFEVAPDIAGVVIDGLPQPSPGGAFVPLEKLQPPAAWDRIGERR